MFLLAFIIGTQMARLKCWKFGECGYTAEENARGVKSRC